MKAHPAAEIFPLLEGDELAALAADIKEHGQRVPIVTHEGRILDGRNRWRACEIAGVEPVTEEWDGAGGSPTWWVLSVNLHRRHLDKSQAAIAAAKAKPLLEAEAKARMLAGKKADPTTNSSEGGESAHLAGQMFGVGGTSVKLAEKVLKTGSPELVRAVEQGKVAVSAAAKLAARPAAEQKAVLAKIEAGEAKNTIQAARRVDEERRAAIPRSENAAARVYIGDAVANLCDLKPRAHCVVMDPPYGLDTHRTRDGGKDYADGEDYALTLLDGVCEQLVRHLDPSAHLYVFSGYSYLAAFREILETYFDVQDNPIVWVKNNHTMCDFAKWYPSKHEYVLFAKMRGSERTLARCVPDVIPAPLERDSTHSAEKPVGLLSTLIEQSTVPGELVIDPFCGSGSTGVAAARLGRSFVGIELDRKWGEVARARLADA